jgi:hypothetical protein
MTAKESVTFSEQGNGNLKKKQHIIIKETFRASVQMNTSSIVSTTILQMEHNYITAQ